MNLDVLLIKLFLQDSSVWFKYGKYVNTKSNNVFAKVYHTVARLKEDGNAAHTVVDLVAKFHTLYPVVSSAELEVFESVSKDLTSTTVEPGQADELLTRVRERSVASEVAIRAVEVASGDVPFSELLDLTEKLEELDEGSAEDEDQFVSDDLVVISDRYQSEAPFQFRLKTLNAVLGGLHRRTFGFIFARPEKGKTQLIASEATYLAPQVESCILWVNNEEDGLALITRCYQAALQQESQVLFKNAAAARDKYNALIKGKIKLYDKPTASARDIERVVQEVKPDIVFIDQLDKVHGFDAERYDLLQKAKYQWARELSKRYNCAVVGICQAGGSAEGKKYLDMNDVDSSHTAKQGEADWMCGMGESTQIGDEDKRFLSFCKNKLPVTPMMKTEMRHAKIAIRSRPEIQIYEDVIHL